MHVRARLEAAELRELLESLEALCVHYLEAADKHLFGGTLQCLYSKFTTNALVLVLHLIHLGRS